MNALAMVGLPIKSPAQSRPVLVFAAASLKTALDTVAAKWRAETGGRVTISYAASSTLAKQIEHGAPADLFISADLDWMDYLQQRKLMDPKTRTNLLRNTLVLVAPVKSTLNLNLVPGFPLIDALGGGWLAMADPNTVPAGRYGKAALTTLGVWDQVAARLAVAENVRAALALVARGETPLGVVYRTDVAAEPGVRILGAFPVGSHPPILYPMALTASAPSLPDATVFAAHLRGARAMAVFEAQGFAVPDHAQ